MRVTELDHLEREEKQRLWRNWCGVAALVAYGVAGTTAWATVGNPKTWASAYNALASAGGLAWLALPLWAVGTVLFIAAAVLTALLKRKGSSGARRLLETLG